MGERAGRAGRNRGGGVRPARHHARMAGKLKSLREKVKRRPPNLRRGNAKRRCAVCVHYDGRGGCMKFGWRVRPAEVCDDFSPKGD